MVNSKFMLNSIVMYDALRANNLHGRDLPEVRRYFFFFCFFASLVREGKKITPDTFI